MVKNNIRNVSMKKFLSLIVCGMLISGAAFASGGEDENTNCNGQGNVNSPCNGNDDNNGPGAVGVGIADANATATSVADAKAESNSTSNSETTSTNTITIEGNKQVKQDIPVNTAYAASLTSGFDTCMGSGSAGLQLMGTGVSGGKTYIDPNCILIKQVQLLTQMGLSKAACFRARMGEEGKNIDAAMELAGVSCETYVVSPPVAPAPIPVTPESTKYATKEELYRAFEKSQSK